MVPKNRANPYQGYAWNHTPYFNKLPMAHFARDPLLPLIYIAKGLAHRKLRYHHLAF
ncbi:hypothetical protein Hanom_Chr17g01544361 [Helianthus anomalus]